MKISPFLFIYLLFPLHVYCQQDAGALLLSLVKANNDANYESLNEMIHPEAGYYIDGKEADSSALIITKANFEFLNQVYSAPMIQLRDLLSDDNLATAEWIFLDSAQLVGEGMISIRLTDHKISIIKIFTGSVENREETNDGPSGRGRAQRVNPGEQEEDNKHYYYYSRRSPGGIMETSGFIVSQVISCESPGIIKGKFSTVHLKGPYSSRQEAAQQRISAIQSARKQSIDLIPESVKCDN